MKTLHEEPATPAIEKAKSGITRRRLFYGMILLCVLAFAILSVLGRLSMLLEAHDWIFGR